MEDDLKKLLKRIEDGLKKELKMEDDLKNKIKMEHDITT
jgi:hypothetical protein